MTPPGSAARFRALHAEGHLLVLPNAWDALSARVVEAAGAQAIATSSAALAWAHGYADGEHLPFEALLAAVRAITAVVSVPVTVDFERGYSDDPGAVAAAVARLAEAGAAGVNLEDRGAPPAALAAKIRACKADAAAREVFVNARTDVFLLGAMPPEQALEEALARGRAYAEAGADGLFVPKLKAPPAIEALVQSTPLPLNLLVVPGLPPTGELAALGVRRLSAGPWLAAAALGAARRACLELLERGSYAALLDSDLSFAALNELFRTAPAQPSGAG